MSRAVFIEQPPAEETPLEAVRFDAAAGRRDSRLSWVQNRWAARALEAAEATYRDHPTERKGGTVPKGARPGLRKLISPTGMIFGNCCRIRS